MKNNHPNRGWRSRWTVDLNKCTATHKDGWVFQFKLTDDPDVWEGENLIMPANPDYSQVARIAREAGDIYHEDLKKRH